ncbi:NAD(P)H-dependent oxidoreductase [Streptomyces sp. A7024]|uniref:NAD(P)H-dependent oxidoreductase n=1 Tax=Streptomyces coryli TaxID=1128680 RepID=A0A6G4U9T9_9ACTN|nr:NAD(P)H-dependent oxidoreductase [Streptomyces coryli]NGN68944.1 NAD(P)H-dependent oxidoreductase [Streptomyces coryli]
MSTYVFILGSARPGGNTETLARAAAEQLPPTAEQRWLRLGELSLPRFGDVRHVGDGAYPEPEGDLRTLFDATLAATDLVIASPLYWYSVSADTKTYLDHWSGWLRVPGADFRARMAGKRLWGVSALADKDPARADPLVGTLRTIADYLRMDWGGVLLGNGSKPGDIAADAAALRAAKSFFG